MTDLKYNLRDIVDQTTIGVVNNKLTVIGAGGDSLQWYPTAIDGDHTFAAGVIYRVNNSEDVSNCTLSAAADNAIVGLLLETQFGMSLSGAGGAIIDDPSDPINPDSPVTLPSHCCYLYKFNAGENHWYLIGRSDTGAGGAGDITAVNSGSGLTGGGTSGAVSLAADFGTGHSQVMRGDSTPTPAAHAASHGTGQSDAISIDAAQVATGTLGAARIPTITSSKIGAGEVQTTNILDGAVTGAKLASGSVTAAKIVAGTITATEIDATTVLAAAQKLKVKNNGTLVGSARDTINLIPGTNTSISATDTGSQINVTVSATAAATTITGTAGNLVRISSGNNPEDSGIADNTVLTTGFLGTGVELFLEVPSSANLAAAVSDETGSGALVFASGPTLIAPVLGTPASGNLANCTGAKVQVNKSGSSPVSEPQVEFIQGTNTTLTVTDVPGSSKVQVQIDSLIPAGAVGTTELAANGVTSAKIAAGAVGSTQLASGAVGSTQLAANAVTTSIITDGNVTLSKLASNSVDSSKIVDGSITGTDIASATIAAANVVGKTLTNAQISDSVVLTSAQKVAVAKAGTVAGTRTELNFTDSSSVTFTLTDDSANGKVDVQATATVGAGTVGTSQIADGSVTTAKLADGSVTNAKIVDGTIAASKLASVTGTGSVVLSTSPTLTTPNLGTPASGNLASCTGLPISGILGFATWMQAFLATGQSSYLASAMVDETGSGALVFATSPTLVTPNLGIPSAATLTNATGLPISTGVSGLGTGVASFLATPSSANLKSAVTDETGSGALVFATSPTLVTPVLGAPTSGTLTNCSGLPISTGVSGLGTGVATFLATPSSANLASAVTDETGSGALVFGTSPTLTSPTLVTPALGTPASGDLSNCTASWMPVDTNVYPGTSGPSLTSGTPTSIISVSVGAGTYAFEAWIPTTVSVASATLGLTLSLGTGHSDEWSAQFITSSTAVANAQAVGTIPLQGGSMASGFTAHHVVRGFYTCGSTQTLGINGYRASGTGTIDIGSTRYLKLTKVA